MSLFIFRFWPVLIPLILYAVWYWRVASKAKKAGKTPPHFRDGPWYWLVLSSLLIGVLCFVWLAATETQADKGHYTPPSLKGGKVIPGHVDP